MIVLCSIFRDSHSYLERYFDQIAELRERIDLKLILAEGDSVDATRPALVGHLMGTDDVCITADHGGPKFASIDHPVRWEQIAYVVRKTLERALREQPDVLVWVESDLLWDADDLLALIDAAKNGRSVTPMVFAEGTNRFYDVYGHRMNGAWFMGHAPYFQGPVEREGVYVKVDSCGSCFATPDMDALRKWDGHWPYHGHGKLWLDTEHKVRHP